MQLRIFQSYYFCHIINESKASTILASRGAELIESLRRKQVRIQAQREGEILQKIKQKMDRIKATQQKLQPTLATPQTHFQGKIVAINVRKKITRVFYWFFFKVKKKNILVKK